jgi:hypothetical protein
MFCSSCGKKLPEGAKFCNGCGKQVVAPMNQKVGNQRPVNPGAVDKKPVNKKLLAIIIASVVAICAIGIGIIVFANRRKSIDLNEYVQVEYDGYDGSATCDLSVDWDSVFEDYPDLDYSKEGLEATDGLIGVLSAKDVLDEEFEVETDDDTALLNGDKISYYWNAYVNEEYFNYDFLYGEGQIVVSGLENDKAGEAKSSDKKSSDTKKESKESEPEEAVESSSSDYICEDARTRKLSDADISAYMSQDWSDKNFPGDRTIVQMMINEIYAEHGYQFSDEELTNYFSQYEWYTSITEKTSDMDSIYQNLSEVEKANVDLLQTYK